MRYRVTPDATRDIEEILTYLATESIDAARRFAMQCDETFAWLAQAPRAGRLWRGRAARTRDVRMWPVAGFPNHLIFYRPARAGVVVLHVMSGARDLDRQLGA